jgi:polyferredoxin
MSSRPNGTAPGDAGPAAPTPRPLIVRLVWARRTSQALFFLVFCWLLAATAFPGDFRTVTERVRLRLPVEAFFMFDPLVALLTLLSRHAVYRGLLWSLVVVALTVVAGRAFCGWICPFGTLHQATAWVFPSRYGKGGRRVAQNKTHPVRQRVKLYLLLGALAAAAFGSAVGGLLDPFSVLVRGLALSVLPGAQYLTFAAADLAGATGLRAVRGASGVVVDALSSVLWPAQQLSVHGGWLLGVLFVAVLVLNRFVPRFWCRVLCPLGALLGLLGRFALFGMRKDHSRCTDCNLCLVHCQGADSPQGGVPWRQQECHVCLNCEAVCPEGVIHFGWLPERGDTELGPNVERRTAIASLAAGAALVPLLRTSDGHATNYSERRIRPPGALPEPEFLARCIRCGECMKVCPNNALQPALLEAGVEGLWTPVLIPRIGPCEQSCVLCGQVCPTGAIRKFTEEQRLGTDGQAIALGTAFFDRGRCLPWAMGTPCIVCEEHCPTSPKAIWVEPVELPARRPPPDDPRGEPRITTVPLQRPHLDPSRCIGCGTCEHVCPVRDLPAVRVTSVGESRSKSNAILL